MSTSKHSHPESRNYQDISTTTGKEGYDTSSRLVLTPASHMGIIDEVLHLLSGTTFDSMQTEIVDNHEYINAYFSNSLVKKFRITYTGASWSLQIISI